jgi:transcriptional regulator with XRE-family HTH domain
MPERKQSESARAFEAAVAEELRALMSRRRVTQAELVRQFGYNQSWLSKRMNGSVPWDTWDLVNVCDYLSATGPTRVDYAELVATAKQRALQEGLSGSGVQAARTGS